MGSSGSFPTSVRMGFVIDVAGYSRRSAREKVDLQQRVATFVGEVLRDLGLTLEQTHHHGTGDGMVVFLPSDVDVPWTLTRLLRSASETVADDNRRYRDRMRLRMAVVVGPLGHAAIGFAGDTIVEAGRMVDSDVLRGALTGSPGADLVVLISDQLYAYVVGERHTGLRAEEFRPVDVRTKEFARQAWLWTPGDQPEPAQPVHRPTTFTAPGVPTCVLGIRPGRILRVHDIDIWVNSENTEMEMARFMEFSISGIIRYNGARRDDGGHVVEDVIADELARVVGPRRPVAPGAAFVTGSGALAASHAVRRIIHVAAVHGEPGAGFQQIRHVGACVANALRQAERLAAEDDAIRTILFPMLGNGVAGGAAAPTATELVGAAVEYLEANPGTRLHGIHFLAFTDAERDALTRTLESHPGLRAA